MKLFSGIWRRDSYCKIMIGTTAFVRPASFSAIAGLLLASIVQPESLSGPEFSGTAGSSAAIHYHQEVKPILQQFCYDCHGDGMKKGNMALDEFTGDPDMPATTATGMPVRTGFFYHPNGVNLNLWHPTGEGRDFQLSKTHEPLAAFKDKLQVFANLDHSGAVARYTNPDGSAGNDGGGDHARAPGVWLTGTRVRKSEKDIRAGISIDQVLAQNIGRLTRFPSLELISDGSRKTGNCDSGYSCEYEYNISWRSATTPNPPEPNPRLVFERLFGAGSPEERAASLAMRKEQRRSVLDFVLEDAKSLTSDLGYGDKQKLDEYLTSVREVEERIANVERFGAVPDPGVEAPTGTPGDFGDRIDMMLEMMYLAFVTDSTRVSSIILARDGDNRTFTWLGQTGGHHSTSHYKNNENRTGNTPEQNLEWMGEIEYWYMKHFAKFVTKLDEAKDAD